MENINLAAMTDQQAMKIAAEMAAVSDIEDILRKIRKMLKVIRKNRREAEKENLLIQQRKRRRERTGAAKYADEQFT